MRFPKTFTRTVNVVGGTVLGSDSAPTGQPQSILPPNNCQFSAALCNVNGFPIQRVVVGYHGPAGAQPLSAALWCWDDETAIWYQVGSAKLLQPEQLTWFDQPTIGAMGPRGQADQSGQVQMFNPGSLDLCLVVSAAGGDPDGTYTFALGMDLSNALGDNVAVSATIDKTGLATSLKQDTGNTSLGSIDTKLSSQATAAKQDTGNAALATIAATQATPGAPAPAKAEVVGGVDGSGNAQALALSTTKALRVVETDVETVVFDLSGNSPGNATPVAGVGTYATIPDLAKYRTFVLHTVLAGVDGDGNAGGTIDMILQCSHDTTDGTNGTWVDWWRSTQVASGATAVRKRVNFALDNMNTTVGEGIPANTAAIVLGAASSSGGHPGKAVRVVWVPGAGVNNAIAQTVKLICTGPKA
jgi:hypothetical protein